MTSEIETLSGIHLVRPLHMIHDTGTLEQSSRTRQIGGNSCAANRTRRPVIQM